MPLEQTLFTRDRQWRVDIEAHNIDLKYFKSTGTHVHVYRKSRTTSMWGSMGETDWDSAPATFIHINSIYRGEGPQVAVREQEWHDTAQAELVQHGVGHELHLPQGELPRDWLSGPVSIRGVESIVTVIVGDETLTGVVSASGAHAKRQTTAA